MLKASQTPQTKLHQKLLQATQVIISLVREKQLLSTHIQRLVSGTPHSSQGQGQDGWLETKKEFIAKSVQTSPDCRLHTSPGLQDHGGGGGACGEEECGGRGKWIVGGGGGATDRSLGRDVGGNPVKWSGKNEAEHGPGIPHKTKPVPNYSMDLAGDDEVLHLTAGNTPTTCTGT